MTVEISHRQCLNMVKEILSQPASDSRRRVVENKFFYVLENGSPKANPQQPQQQPHKQLQPAADNDIINDVPRDLR